jgi:hypothetical protein
MHRGSWGLDPRLTELGMLHAFSTEDKVTVDGMDSTITALDDRWIMKRTLFFFFEIFRG